MPDLTDAPVPDDPDAMVENPARPESDYLGITDRDGVSLEVQLSKFNNEELRSLVLVLSNDFAGADAKLKSTIEQMSREYGQKTQYMLTDPTTQHLTCQWCAGDLETSPSDAPSSKSRGKR